MLTPYSLISRSAAHRVRVRTGLLFVVSVHFKIKQKTNPFWHNRPSNDHRVTRVGQWYYIFCCWYVEGCAQIEGFSMGKTWIVLMWTFGAGGQLNEKSEGGCCLEQSGRSGSDREVPPPPRRRGRLAVGVRQHEPLISPQNGGLIIWPPSVRPYVRTYVRTSVRGQRFLRSVWVNWFETLGQEQVRSEDYARQIDFWYPSKWRPDGHLGCKQTLSRNSNNTNWISFKLGAKRTLGMANMYAHLFSVWFKKWRHGGHICFFTPMITLFWLISRKLCKIGD